MITALKRFRLCLLITTCFVAGCAFQGSKHTVEFPNTGWYPSQKKPSAVVQLSGMASFSEKVLAQSLSGQAAQAVNNEGSDELVWIEFDSKEYMYLFHSTMARLGIAAARQSDVWSLASEYHEKGLVKGYILYTDPASETVECDSDYSINIATSMAGILNGVLIEESLESKATEIGLTKLYDARNKMALDVFEQYQPQFNRNLVFAADPKKVFVRDMAIAHRCMAIYGTDETTKKVFQWLNPLSVIIGWNKGDEFEHISLASRWGHVETVSDWCVNLPFLSAGTQQAVITQPKSIKPWEIDFEDDNDGMAFLFSDGDNVQWNMGGFNFSKQYWANEHHGQFPMSWTVSAANLVQVSPATHNYRAMTQPVSTSQVEFSGGYFYPDLFAAERPNRKELLRAYAKRFSKQLSRTGVKVVCMLCEDVKSQNAKDAYKIFAEELDGIIGMIALQYYPYDGGNGKILWYTNNEGVDIPLVMIKYSTWLNAGWERGGNPDKIAALIKSRKTNQADQTFEIIAHHAWSVYDINDQKVGGLDAIKFLYDEIKEDLTVMSVEHLIWRIRMQFRPKQTKTIIKKMQ